MKLLIAIPSLDMMHTEFVKSLLALQRRLDEDGIEYHIEIKSGTLVYVARDLLATKARQEDFTHVLWIDSDMVFTEDLVDDLLFSGKPFVSAICHARRPPHVSCLFKSLDPIDRYVYGEYGAEPFEVEACGMGCVLMETEVIKAIWEKYTFCFLPHEKYGEDLAFCMRARECGFSIWADPSVQLGHVGYKTVYPQDEIDWEKRMGSIERFL